MRQLKMYPNHNFYNSAFTANQQTGAANTGYFSRPMPQNHNIPQQQFPPHQFGGSGGLNSFDFRHPPPAPPMPTLNSTAFLPLPPPPVPPSQYQLQGLFQAPRFPMINRPVSNFAGRNVIFSSSSSTVAYPPAASQNHSNIINIQSSNTSTISSTIPNPQQPIPTPLTQQNLPPILQPILPTSQNRTPPNVLISEELHINTSNLSEGISEDHNNPLGKRTVINELALAKLAKNTQNNESPSAGKENLQQKQPKETTIGAAEQSKTTQNANHQNGDQMMAATTTESSPESIELGGQGGVENGEIDDEEEMEIDDNPEMPLNWRMMMLFNGRIQDGALAPNCERPQQTENIRYPYPETVKKEWNMDNKRQQSPEDFDDDSDEDLEFEGAELMEGTSSQQQQQTIHHNLRRVRSATVLNKQIFKRAKSVPPPPVPPLPLLKPQSHGYVLPNGRTWVRNLLPESATTAENLNKSPSALLNSSNGSTNAAQSPATNAAMGRQLPTQNPTQKRFANNTLLIMKNGKRLPGGTKECYQFAETGRCLSGIFCNFQHNGSVEHSKQKVCNRLLRGLCRHTDDPTNNSNHQKCPGGPHSPLLLPHQMPVCDFFLRLVCSKGKDACPFLHVRHTPGAQKCKDFNRGNCQRGIMCDAPHQYVYHIIKEKSAPSEATTKTQRSKERSPSGGNRNQQNVFRFHMNKSTAAAAGETTPKKMVAEKNTTSNSSASKTPSSTKNSNQMNNSINLTSPAIESSTESPASPEAESPESPPPSPLKWIDQ